MSYMKAPEKKPMDIKYGVNKPQIHGSVEIEGGGSGGGVKTLKIIRLASNGIQIENITGFGFTPTSYEITAVRRGNSARPTYSICGYDGTTEGGLAVYANSSVEYPGSIKINYANDGGGQTYRYFNGFILDGISLDFQTSSEDIFMTITAYA